MRGIRTFVTAVVAVLITASACSTSHSSSSAKVHAKSVAQQGQEVIDTQKQIPPLQTAAQFCLDGIKKDSKDTAIDEALNTIDPSGGEAAAWEFSNLQGDQVTMQKELADGKLLSGTFDLGQIIYAIIGSAGEHATKGTPDEIQWKLFNLIGADAIYCAEAAFWLDGTVGGQIGTAIQKKFLAWPVGQQLLAGRGSAISGEWVLHRKVATCGVHDCQLNVMDVTISCAGGSCSVIRTNGSSNGAPPWDHAIPFAFSNGAWRGSGKEQNAAVCGKSPVPGTGVSLTLKVISGGIADGVWRARQLSGTLDIANVPTKCDSNAVTSHEVVSTTPF